MRSDSNVLQHFFLRHLQQIHAIPKARWGECAERLALPLHVDGGLLDPGIQLGSGRGPPHGSFRFLPGDIRMLAGEARDIASDRAGFLGSHPEAGATRAPRKRQ